MPSGPFKVMNTQLKILRKSLLPIQFDRMGIYRYHRRVSARVIAYRLMVHAEFEHYVEIRCKDVAKHALSSFSQKAHITRGALALLAFNECKTEALPSSLAPPTGIDQKAWEKKIGIEGRLKSAMDTYLKRVVETNHGIREQNILSLVLPIGVSHTDLDPLWLTNLDQFGVQRGLAAHNSSTIGALSTSMDPKTEYDLVINQLLPGFVNLDTVIDKLLR